MVIANISQYYERFSTSIITEHWFYWLLGAIGLFFLAFLFVGLRRHQGMRVYRDESGSASVSISALKDLVHLACSKVETATKPKIQVKPRRGRLDLTLKVKLYEGQRLNILRDRLRRSVIRTFEEDHGIRLGDINVIIVGFKKGGGAPEGSHEEAESERPSQGSQEGAAAESQSAGSLSEQENLKTQLFFI